MNTRISKTELQKAGAASIPLQKSHGFLVQLGVFHELHCLVRRVHKGFEFPDGKTHALAEDPSKVALSRTLLRRLVE